MRGSVAIQHLQILPRVHYAMLIMTFLVNSRVTHSWLTGKCTYSYITSYALSVNLSGNKTEHPYQENIKVQTFRFLSQYFKISCMFSVKILLFKHALPKKKIIFVFSHRLYYLLLLLKKKKCFTLVSVMCKKKPQICP